MRRSLPYFILRSLAPFGAMSAAIGIVAAGPGLKPESEVSVPDKNGSNVFGDKLTVFEWHFYVFNGIIGTILNFAVLLIGLLHTDTHDKPRQIIVINMTFADLATCLVYMLTRPYLDGFALVMCYPYYVIIFTSQLCSCLNLLWLNVDKLIYIKFPLHYYKLVTRTRVLVLTVFSWVTLIVLALVIYSFMDVLHACNVVQISPMIYLPICIVYILMISDSFIISAVIYCIAQNSRRMEAEAKSRLFQRLFFVFSSTLWTFVTCLPYRLLYLTNVLCATCRSEVLTHTTDVFFSILVLGIVINPVVTIVTQRLYRQCVAAYAHRLVIAILRKLPFCASLPFCVEFQNNKQGKRFEPGHRRKSRPVNPTSTAITSLCKERKSTKSSNRDENSRKKAAAFAKSRGLSIYNSADSRNDLIDCTILQKQTQDGQNCTRIDDKSSKDVEISLLYGNDDDKSEAV